MSDVIRLERVSTEGNRLNFDFSSNLPFFRKKRFFVEYDADVSGVPESLLAVPFAAAVAPVAWAAGAKLEIGPLDRDFLASLDRCRDYFRRQFVGRWSFKSSVDAAPVENPASASETGMLFSSGLDSLTTYIHRKDERPVLYTIFGADIPLLHSNFIELCRRRLDDFSRAHDAEIHYIRTDVRDTLDFDRLKRYSKNWYGEVAHGLMMSALVAPVGHGRLRTLYVASCSHRADLGHACGSDSELLRRVRWAGLSVRNDSQELSRTEKIGLYLKGNEAFYPSLRVCWMQFKSLNCSRCEKCLRTICELLANNIDPARCNFAVGPETLPALRRRMETQYYLFFHNESALDFWRSLQEEIDLDAIDDLYGSRAFFEWFAGFQPLRRKQNALLRAASAGLIEARDAVSARASAVKRALSASWTAPALKRAQL